MAKGGDGMWGLIVVEERDEHMVSHIVENPTLRPARFLKPSMTHFEKVAKFPSLCGILAYTRKKWDFFDVQFKGWKNPQKKWKQWVDQMCEIYGEMWKVTGIYDTIIGSTYEIKKDREMVLGLVEWWCPETNTFVFLWGEVTITLEDVMLIRGLSVLGKPVTTCLSGVLVNIEDEMIKQFRICYKSKWKKVHHSAWMNQFMGNNLELDHVAFLAFWLSKFVFHAYSEYIICKKVFPVTIRLAQGIRIAFAPTIWAYERLPTLRPESKSFRPGKPRMARWHKLNSSSDLKILRFHMSSPKNFQIRPYMSFVENLTQPSFWKEQGEWVLGNINTEEELRSFSRCIRPCELVRLDFIEQYLPHRVGMQFGMDQDLPDGQQDVEYILALESTSKNLDKSFIKKEVDTLTGQKANENILEEEMDSKSLDITLPEKGSDDLLVPPVFLPKDKDKFKLTQMYKHVKHKKSNAFAHSPTAPDEGGDYKIEGIHWDFMSVDGEDEKKDAEEVGGYTTDAVGAFLVMDMAHIIGLVAASVVENSFEYCDVVTITTHNMRLVYRKYLLIDPSLSHLVIGFGWLVRVYTFKIIMKEKWVFTNVISTSGKAKLRLLFLVAPLGLLVEKVGGYSSDGYKSVLDKSDHCYTSWRISAKLMYRGSYLLDAVDSLRPPIQDI
ncbi:hypothetical protein GIB67_032070 [Kingdonia uniflora]|uniref:Aminotransferase-like plant mobile domain-containing protein n=1 Tax=Kingdonia uniflora TaxID=39325 RepID=A0A7J7MWI5_9MAGN|nr:hypothetical protein GIB67_032070 [Kingdonia uniflora]